MDTNSLYTHSASSSTDAQQKLATFWNTISDDVNSVQDFKTQELPLARIKKIMKMDEDVKMISAEAPVLFAKAAEIFINELSLRAWTHTEDNKRRTLQRNDIAMAITKYDQFDFLIDIVPRDELKPQKRQVTDEMRLPNSEQVQYYFQLANPGNNTNNANPGLQTNQPQVQQAQQNAQVQPAQAQANQQLVIGNQSTIQLTTSNGIQQLQPTQVMQAVAVQQGNTLNQSVTTTQPNTTTTESNGQLYNMAALRFGSQLPNYSRGLENNQQYQYNPQQLSYLQQPQVQYNANQQNAYGQNNQQPTNNRQE